MDSSHDLQRPLMHNADDSEESDDIVSLKGFLRDGYATGEGSAEDRRRRNQKRYLSYGIAILSCLCAGSITAFSLYGPLFISRLRYTQLEVNAVSITAELAMYLPVPLVGYVCDRYNPGIVSLLAGVLFGAGYFLAALTYHRGPPAAAGGHGWPLSVMILAFVGVGTGTSSMYLSAVTTCAKNFGRGRHKGLALAMPIAAFGLSGMWQSQLGSWLFSEHDPVHGHKELDVYKFFLFLSVLLFTVGIVGAFCLRVVDEEDLIDEAVEELERSGFLDEHLLDSTSSHAGYGTVPDQDPPTDGMPPLLRGQSANKPTNVEAKWKKAWVLNAETRRFLRDHTMWWLAAGFFLVTGPGEAFINNLGTIIGTLHTSSSENSLPRTTPATHVSIVAVTSTIARILTGTFSDMFAPVASTQQHLSSSMHSQSHLPSSSPARKPFRVSRITLLITFALIVSIGQVVLASGAVQNHAAERFWIVSGLIGTGYGAVFSLTPIIVSVIWGVENFGTNWGVVVVMPAFGATLWGLVYSVLYQAATATATVGRGTSTVFSRDFSSGDHIDVWASSATASKDHDGADVALPLCFGKPCYAYTFWAMAVSVWLACAMWFWAWKGPGGWSRRGIVV